MAPETGETRSTTILLQLEQSNGADDHAVLRSGTPDIDWFSMTLGPGRSYVIEVDRAQYRFDTTRDTAG